MSSTQNDCTKEAVNVQQVDLIEQLARLTDKFGVVTFTRNNDGTYDVRAGGCATYSHSLRHSVRMRAEIEMISEVTTKLEGTETVPGNALQTSRRYVSGPGMISKASRP